ncbi:MAG TPA: glycosyltransferase [Thermomicrobiales bacterium]|nr:glycosyltransferase [Thermomicrobiales bacterium]
MRSSSSGAGLAFFYPQLKKLTGAQRLILMLARHTARAGAAVTLVTHRVAPEVRAALDPAVGLVETGRRVDRFGNHYLDAALEYLLGPALLAAVPPGTAAVVFFGPPSLPALWWARRRWGHARPLLYFCYEPPRAAYTDRALVARRFGPAAPLVATAARLYRPLDRAFARAADAIFANGRYGQTLIRAAYGVEATILPHGVEHAPPTPAAVRAARTRWGIRDDQTTLLTVNQLHPRKRLDLCLRAVTAARAQGVAARALIAGDGAARGELEALARALGLAGAVTFCGFVPDADLPALYAACDIYLHTGRAESFGLSVLEAAASGLPVVAVAEGGPLEILRDGETGLLVPPTPACLAAAIAALARDPAAARALGARARADVAARYRWEDGAAEMLAALAGLRAENSGLSVSSSGGSPADAHAPGNPLSPESCEGVNQSCLGGTPP